MNSKEQIKEQIRKVAQVYLPGGSSVFIFGSQANLENLKPADIDVGILPSQPIDLYQFLEFKETLQSTPNLYTFDVVDFQKVSAAFRNIAMRNIGYILR